MTLSEGQRQVCVWLEKLSDWLKVTKLPGGTVGTDAKSRWTVLYIIPGITTRLTSQVHPPLFLLGAVEEGQWLGWRQDRSAHGVVARSEEDGVCQGLELCSKRNLIKCSLVIVINVIAIPWHLALSRLQPLFIAALP